MKSVRLFPSALLLVVVSVLWLVSAHSVAEVDEAAAQAEPEEATAQVDVVEFFWYGCPHCYRFQPHLHGWLEDKPDYVDFRMVPAVLSPDWEVHARAFYAAQLLGELDRFHFAFYEALHQDGRRLDTTEAIAEFAGSLGFDQERFASTMDSFAVENRLREARQLNRDYGLRGTPSVGVAGEHIVSPREVGSFAELLEQVDRHAAEARGGDDG